MRAATIVVDYMGPSLNSVYSGAHWSKRKRHADDAHLAVKISAKGVEKFANPVKLTFQPMIKGRRLDVSNYAYTCKLCEDGLVRAGVLKDDSIKWVKQITIKEPIKADVSRMVITIVEVENET